MSLSFDEFKKAKKKGLIAWDEDLINSFSQQTNDAAKSTEGLRPRDFDENKKKVTDLEQNRQYVQTYIDSLKGSEGYDAAKKSFDSVNDSFNKTKGFYDQFKDRKAYDTYVGESYLQGKQVKSELIRAASQAEIAGYEKRYEGKTYKELKAAAASAKDEKEKSWLNKRAEEKSSAQEYYNDNIAGIEKKKEAATARLNELQQSPNPLGLTIDRQREYSAIGKEIEGYDSELAKLNKVYKKKVSKETENEERKISARYAHKYEGKTVSDLLEARKTVEGESESEWLKNKILNNASYDELSSLKESMKKSVSNDFNSLSEFSSYYNYGDNTALNRNQKAKYGITVEEIDSALEEKGEEKYYNDILKKDTKAITKVQRYYALKNGKIGFKSDGTVGETGGNEDVADSYVEGQYKSKNNNALESEKAKIIQDFEDLKAQGYDADKMLAYYSRIKENEDAENKLASIEQKTKKDPVGMSVASVPANMVGSIVDGAKLIAANIGRNFGGDGYYNPKTTQNKAAETIRNTVNQMIDEGVSDEALSQTAQFLYQTGMSMGDMVSAVAVNSIPYVGPALSSAMFFTSSGVSNANRVIENGGTLDDATKTFVATGSAELFFESVSLEQLKAFKQQGVSKVSDAVKNTLKATFTEGSEELFTDVCNAITDQVINGDLSELSTKYKNYKKQGMSDDEAASAVAGEFATQLGLSFAGGALSGAVIGGAENTVLYTGSKIDDKKMIAALYQQAAQELSEDAKYESVKKDLIEQAKNSGDAKAVKMANNFEKTVQRHNGDYSAITVTDVGNLMQVLDGADTTQTADNAEATQRSSNTAANAKEAPSAVGSAMDQAQRAASNTQYRATVNRQFTDSGQIKSTAGVNLNAFGKNHAGGVKVVEKLDPEVTHDIVRIESSAKEYGSRENTVTLLTADGKYINADDVQMPTAEQDTLIREAVNFDTNGARALMANYDGYAEYCKQTGKNADVHEYIKQFDALYRLGETGVRYESLQKVGSPRYNKIADIIGAEQAQNALNAGANDVDATFMHESNTRQKVRIPGHKNTAQSKVSVEVGEDFTRAFDDGLINTLQSIAVKTGRDIVLSDKLSEGNNGMFGKDGRIYINANTENSNYAVSVALHEAIHSARDVAPMEYLSLERFIVNYLTEKGENIDELLYDIVKRWGEDAPNRYAVREELVAQTVMALASDENALRTAIECKENKNLLDKALDALKRIAQSVKEFMQGIVKDGKVQGAHNLQAQAWLKDAEALEQLAQRFSELMDEVRAEMEESGQKNNTHGVRYSKEDEVGNYEIRRDIKGNQVVVINDNILKGVKTGIKQAISNTIARHIGEYYRIIESGQKVFIGDDLPNEFTYSEYSKALSKSSKSLFAAKGKTSDQLGNLIEIASKRRWKKNEKTKHNRDAKYGWYRYQTRFALPIRDDQNNTVGYNIYRANLLIRNDENGKKYLYDLIDIKKEKSNQMNALVNKSSNFLTGKSKTGKGVTLLSNEIVTQSSEKSNTPNGRKSKDDTIDADYLSAVERGDMETAQRMVDDAAERAFANSKIRDEDGKLLKVYHGSDADFTVFDKTKGRANMDIQGMFFSPWELDASGYGQNVRAFYLNVTNPANESTGYKALNRHMKENNAGVKAREDLERMGYDGVNNEDEEFIAFSSEQIKSADPVTYDDEGNVIPLSERFKTENKDIRYSKDDTIDSDLFDIDDDLFEEDNRKYLDEMIKTDPNGAVMAMTNSLAKTGESVIKGFQGVRLNEENYLKIARRLMKRYEIKLKYNPGFDKKFAADIQRFVEQFKDHPNINFEEALNTLCRDCKSYLLLSGDFNDVFKEQRSALMDMLRGGTLILDNYVADQILENYGSMKNLRRAFLGKAFVGFQRDKVKYKKPLDPLEVVEQFRDMFGHEWVQDDDLDSFECWRWLDDTLNGRLQPKYINPFINGERAVYQSIDTASAEMGMEILSELINEKSDAASKSKTADKKTIRELKEQQEKGTSKKVEYLRAQKEKYQKLAEEEKQKRLLKGTERDAYRKKVASLEDENRRYKGLIYTEEQTVRQQYIEAREKVRYRKLLAKELGRMTKMLDGKANNNVYIPDKLKKPILNVLNLFEVLPDNGQQLPQYWSQFRNLKDVGNRIDELTTEYSKLSTGGVVENIFGDQFNADNLAYDEAVKDALRFLADNVKGKNVYALNAEELRNIYEGMRMLDAQLKRAVQVIVDGKTEYIDELAGQAVDEVEKVHFNKGSDKNALAMLRNAAVATHLDPVRYGRFLSGYHDDYVIAKLFKDLHNGDKKRVKIIYQAFTELERTLHETFSDKELKQLQTKDNEGFSFTDLKTGKRVKVSDAVLVSLYLTNAQEDGHRQLVNDKANHYTLLPDLDMMNRDKIPVAGNTVASMTHAHQKATGEAAHHIRLSKFDMEQINEYIDNNRKLSKLCDAVSGVFNGIIKDEINKVSLQRYGKMIATVKNYYPLSTYDKYAGKKFEVEVGESLKDVRLKSRSFTKQRTHAYNALVIDDVFNVFLKHVQETAEYCGMLIPVENFKRVYGKGNDQIVLSEAIQDKFGGSAGHYIKKLMDDIQKPKDTIDQNFLTRMHGNYMGAVLMLNPGAALKQFAAYPTAFKYFGIGNVSKSIPMGFAKGKGLVEKYSAYTPYMWYRENGNGTVVAEVSKQLGITSKAKNRLDLMGKADRLVVNSLLYAAEEHVRKTRTDLTYDSEAFKQEVAAQFERAIDESQPNNMITSKPQFVRNNVLRILNVNAFLSQNMAMGNGIIDSGMELAARIHEHKESKTEESAAAMKQSALRFISHMLGVGLSAALLSFLKQIADLLIYHKWDDTKDEEGKTDWGLIGDKWLNDFFDAYTGAFAQGDKIFSAIKVLMGAEKWQDMEVFSLSTINDIISNAGNGNYTKAISKLLDLTGLPATNALRLGNGLYHTFFDLWDGNTYPIGGDHTIFKNNGDLDTKHFGFYVVSYTKNSDKAEAEKYENLWKAELMKGGKSENEAMDKIKKGLSEALAATDADVTDAFVAYQNGNMAKYDKLFDKLTGYGFDPSDVDKAIESVKTLTYKEMKERGVTQKDAQADLTEQGFNEDAAKKLAEGYDKPEKEAPESAFDDTSEGKLKKFEIKDGITALKNGDKTTYEEIRSYVVEHNDKIADNEEFDKKMKSTTYTGGIIQNYLDALDSGKDKEREAYQQQLVNIYGSWDEVVEAINRYRKAKNKK